jgi:hypothetical protein
VSVNPSELKVIAFACGLLSLTLLVTAAWQWNSRPASDASDPSERSGWRGNLTLFAVSLLVLVGLLAGAAQAGWSRNRTLWVGLGSFLVLLTVTRPWWFWENWKAHWLRRLMGDTGTVLVYLLLGGAMVWIGWNTDWVFGRQ